MCSLFTTQTRKQVWTDFRKAVYVVTPLTSFIAPDPPEYFKVIIIAFLITFERKRFQPG